DRLAALGYDERPGVQADPHRQLRPVAGREARVHALHRIEDREARADGTLGVVLARVWPAEVDDEAVAQLLRHVAAETGDRGGYRLLVLCDDVPPFLGVELLGERGRPDEVAEEDRELAALAGCGVRCRQRRLCTPRNPRVLTKRGATVPAELLARLDDRSARLTSAAETTPAFRAEAAVRAVPVTARRAAERAVNLHERLRPGRPNVPASPPRAGSVSITYGPELAGDSPTSGSSDFRSSPDRAPVLSAFCPCTSGNRCPKCRSRGSGTGVISCR